MAKPSWITLSKSSGTGNDSVNVTAAAYTGREKRSGMITANATGGGSDTSTVEQAGAAEFIRVISLTKSVNSSGGTVDFTGTSNCKDLKVVVVGTSDIKTAGYSLEVDGEPAGSWDGSGDIQVPDDPGASAQYDFTLHVTLSENRSESAVKLLLYLTNANGDVESEVLTVSQSANARNYAAPVISSFTYGSGNIPAAGGTLTPTLAYSQTWGWGTSTTDGGTLSGTLSSPIPGSTFLFDGATNETTGAVSAPSKGSTVSDVTAVATVTAKVTVNGKSSSVSAAQTVRQAANTITYGDVTWSDRTPSAAIIPASGGTSEITWSGSGGHIAQQEISYSSGVTGTVTDEEAGVVGVPALSKISISYSEDVTAPSKGTNVSGVTNVGSVEITAEGNGGKSAKRSVTIQQAANAADYGEVSINEDSSISLSASGQSYRIDADARQTVTYTSGATRTQSSSNPVQISLDYEVKTPSSGFSLDDAGEVTVTANPTASVRGGFVVTVTATGEGGKTAEKDITFTQQSADSSITLSPATLSFAAGGETKELTVASNDSWTLS